MQNACLDADIQNTHDQAGQISYQLPSTEARLYERETLAVVSDTELPVIPHFPRYLHLHGKL